MIAVLSMHTMGLYGSLQEFPLDEQYQAVKTRISHDLIQVALRLVCALLLLWICAKIFAPFAALMAWALILAITLYPLHLRLRDALAWSDARTATVISGSGLLLLGVPTVLLGMSLVDHIASIITQWQQGSLDIVPPDESVKDWPLVGERVYAIWLEASDNLAELLADHGEEVRSLLKRFVGGTTSMLTTVGLFLGAIVVAGIMMAYGRAGSSAMGRIAVTLVGNARGEELQVLSVATTRSVATGVIGVAVIQSLLLGIGFLWAEVPAAGVLAVLALITGIIQLPALLITLPVLIWLWTSGGAGEASAVMDVVITIYLIIAGLADNVLKPILLGRGVDVPMPVVLIGALGGMVGMGLIGLFIGSVVLAIGYQLLWAWVDREARQAAVNETSDPS